MVQGQLQGFKNMEHPANLQKCLVIFIILTILFSNIIILFISTLPTYQNIQMNNCGPKLINQMNLIKPSEEILNYCSHAPISTRSSNWTQSTFSDFTNGTLDNLTIINHNDEPTLKIKFPELNEWYRLYPNVSASARSLHSMAAIYNTDKVLIFGGGIAYGSFLNDTWIYDYSENNWTRKYPKTSPPARAAAGMAPIFGTDKILLFGGFYYDITLNDTWVYDLSENNWTKKFPINCPYARDFCGMSSIPNDDKVLLFGGCDYSQTFYYNDTWVFDLSANRWTKKVPKASPDVRAFRSMTSMVSIGGTDKFLVFGGVYPYSSYNDTWVYDLSDDNWTKMNTKNKPDYYSTNSFASLNYKYKVVGWGEYWSKLHDTWLYDLFENDWSLKNLIIEPPRNYYHTMVNIYNTSYVVLFGGTDISHNIYNETWIFHHETYLGNGTFTSEPFDTQEHSTFESMVWNVVTTSNTSFRIQLRSASSKDLLNSTEFIGPDGKSTTFYNVSPSNIYPGHNGHRWVQYRVYFYSKSIYESPLFKSITINYNSWPVTYLVQPINNSIVPHNYPLFHWDCFDRDSEPQVAFQVIIDDTPDFSDIDFTSGISNTTEPFWSFPDGTLYSEIPDGTWYWKVRTKDSDGAWGLYSKPWKFIIDSQSPTSSIKNPKNNGIFNKVNNISGFGNKAKYGIDLEKVEISIKRLDDNRTWDTTTWVQDEVWLTVNGTDLWWFDSTAVAWLSGGQYRLSSRASDVMKNREIPGVGNTFTYDSAPVIFSNPRPAPNKISKTTNLDVKITIYDNLSGVNGSTMQYSISIDSGLTWSPWKTVPGLGNSNIMHATVNLDLPNGTGNRIKWRASDVVGNGPTESAAYNILVDIREPEEVLKPEVRLWSPPNGTILQASSVNISWFLVSSESNNVVFDLYLDDNMPPNICIVENLSETYYFVENLDIDRTYYWTVIPKIGNLSGTCLSGIWSFSIDIPLPPIPKVILKIPENGSTIQSQMPTLVWGLEYTGTESVEYLLYFGTTPDPGLRMDNITSTYYSIDEPLSDNTTYYWYIEPFAGGLRGYSSPIWSFIVKLKQDNNIPEFGIELVLDPNPLEIRPGEVKFALAVVTNLGELNDNFTVSIGDINGTGLTAEVYRQDTMEIVPGKDKEFLIMISVQEGTEPGYGSITIFARSKLAEQYGLEAQDSKELTIKIIEKEVQKHRDRPTSTFYFSILILIVILIIIFIIILILIRKKTSKKDTVVEDRQEVITKAPVENIAAQEPEPIVEPVPPVPVSVPIEQPEENQEIQQNGQEE